MEERQTRDEWPLLERMLMEMLEIIFFFLVSFISFWLLYYIITEEVNSYLYFYFYLSFSFYFYSLTASYILGSSCFFDKFYIFCGDFYDPILIKATFWFFCYSFITDCIFLLSSIYIYSRPTLFSSFLLKLLKM